MWDGGSGCTPGSQICLTDRGITQMLQGTPVFTFYVPGKVIGAENTLESKRLQSPTS